MRIRKSQSRAADQIELQMTPMIDIVFQLLVFFIMTFKIVAQEGDFNIKMPLAAPNQGKIDDQQLPLMKLRLLANAEGDLVGMNLNDAPFSSFVELHEHIRGLIGDESGPGSFQEQAEVEIDADYNLKYSNVIEAITAVSGYIKDDNVIKLIEKIKFASPKEPTDESL